MSPGQEDSAQLQNLALHVSLSVLRVRDQTTRLMKRTHHISKASRLMCTTLSLVMMNGIMAKDLTCTGSGCADIWKNEKIKKSSPSSHGFVEYVDVRRLPAAFHGRRMHHKNMYKGFAYTEHARSMRFVHGNASCMFKDFSSGYLKRYAEDVSAHLRAQLVLHGVSVESCKTCLFSGLAGAEDDAYIDGHQAFMDSLLQFHPYLKIPMIIMELDYDGSEGSGLKDETIYTLQHQYNETVRLKPMICPEVPFQWPLIRFANNRRSLQSSSILATRRFYRRLQMFALSQCSSIVALDTSDMIVLRPIPHLLSPSFLLNETDFVAAARCDSRFMKNGVSRYFNAGLFIVGRKHINVATLASLMSIVIFPLYASAYDSKSWAADQDVLNLYFGPERGGQDVTVIGCENNYAKNFADFSKPWYEHCPHPSEARIIHYLGTKPWVPTTRRKRKDLLPELIHLEKKWFSRHFSHKTIVVVGRGERHHTL
eukprot:6173558-Pleurochrysis_carterae.AAC.1